jgi:phosphoribosylpyrophosphate synthetase
MVFMGDALTVLGGTEFDGIIVADTVLSTAEAAGLLPENVTMLDTSRLVGDVIALTHTGI